VGGENYCIGNLPPSQNRTTGELSIPQLPFVLIGLGLRCNSFIRLSREFCGFRWVRLHCTCIFPIGIPPPKPRPMLTLFGPRHRYCDGVSRRSFLKVGSLATCGLFYPGMSRSQLMAAEDAAARRSHKAVIMVYLSGGLSHQDTVDLKPESPTEIRGEFSPIDTNVPGIQVCEHLPKLAATMDKLIVLRSIVGQRDEHSSFQNLTGVPMSVSQRDGTPNFGSVVSRVQGPTNMVVPAYVDLFPTMQHRPYNIPGPGVLGRVHAGVKADGEDMASMKLRFISPARFNNRQSLLSSIDALERQAASAEADGVHTNYRQAFDVLTSNKLVDAVDLEKEDAKVRERYGGGSSKHQGDGAPLWNDQLLIARRLVEAGARCVTVAYGFWDTHGNNFSHLRKNLPQFDIGISALVQDLHDRGLQDDVTLVVWGEFGRTPKINDKAGRDHWSRVNSAILAGGGMPTGQVIGSTDRIGGEAVERPIHYRDILATVYHNLGIDPETTVPDQSDRPTRIQPDDAKAIRELV